MADEQAPQFDLTVNLRALTWGDWEFLLDLETRQEKSAGGAAVTGDELRRLGRMFNHCIVGGVEHLPMMDSLPAIMAAFRQAAQETRNPLDSSGKVSAGALPRTSGAAKRPRRRNTSN